MSFVVAGFLVLYALQARDSMCDSSGTPVILNLISLAFVVGVVEAIVGWSVRRRWKTRLATSGIVLMVAAMGSLLVLPWTSSASCGD